MKNKIIASGLAGLALLGGTIAFAVGTTGAGQRHRPPPSRPSPRTPPPAASGAGSTSTARRSASEAVETAADTIGIPVDELKADLKAGQSIAEIATAHGVDPQKVADALGPGRRRPHRPGRRRRQAHPGAGRQGQGQGARAWPPRSSTATRATARPPRATEPRRSSPGLHRSPSRMPALRSERPAVPGAPGPRRASSA